jgi:nucleoside-diphosphate-sugar epimerase
MSSQLIFVTGANGFLGGHIVHQLLESGYRVRGTARGAKVALSQEMFASYGDKFEAVLVNDIAKDDISEYLKGVDAVMHVAAPLPSKGDQKALLNGARDGSLNIIRQAEKAGIRRIVYTSSIVTVLNPSGSLTDKDWNPMTEQETLTAAPHPAYMGGKNCC